MRNSGKGVLLVQLSGCAEPTGAVKPAWRVGSERVVVDSCGRSGLRQDGRTVKLRRPSFKASNLARLEAAVALRKRAAAAHREAAAREAARAVALAARAREFRARVLSQTAHERLPEPHPRRGARPLRLHAPNQAAAVGPSASLGETMASAIEGRVGVAPPRVVVLGRRHAIRAGLAAKRVDATK